jgi:bifunctional non-homologous end joining protein LigD
LLARLPELATQAWPLGGPPPPVKGSRWVRPLLRCEVRYKEWTEGGQLRHPVLLSIGEEEPPSGLVGGTAPSPATAPPAQGPPELRLTRLEKVFWPEEGYTKGDLIHYYRSVADAMLPYLRDRPLVLTRYPDGIAGKSFYQKNAPGHAPDWIQTETIWSESSERDIEYFIVQEPESLVFMANLGAILLHVWSSRLATIEHPDWCILDLDPKDAPFRDVVAVARAVHELCDAIGMPNFVKTSGSTGLHVLLPLGRQVSYDQSRLIGELISRVVVREHPGISTIDRVIKKRGGKVYLDYMQNGHGQLLVAPFSVRPLPGAPVSTPLHWNEVDQELRLSDWTIETVPRRLARQKKDPWAGLLELEPDLPSILGALAARSEPSAAGSA